MGVRCTLFVHVISIRILSQLYELRTHHPTRFWESVMMLITRFDGSNAVEMEEVFGIFWRGEARDKIDVYTCSLRP